MQLRTVRNLRWGRSIVLATIVACATLAATASSALAWGDGDRDSYTASVSPASVAPSSSTQFTVALANTSSSGSGLSSALITPPLGFRVTGASLNGAPGHAYVIFNTVVLDHLSVAPGSTLKVLVTATAPSRCDSPFTRWFTWANEGGFWSEDLRLDASNSSVTTTVPCATAVKFDTQPTDAVINTAITGSANNASGPPIKVDIVDASGNTVNSSASVTIALGKNPGGAALGGNTTQNAVNGVATFNDLTLDKPDNGYTLVATTLGLASATSNSFNENDQAQACTTGTDCSSTISSGSGSLQVDIANPTVPETITLSKDIGTPMDGANGLGDPGCSSYNPPDASADWYEAVVTPSDGTTFDAKQVTWVVHGTTSDGFQVCFGAPYSFTTSSGDTAQGGQTLPDGSTGFVGLLPGCGEGEFGSPPPCFTSSTTFDDAGVPTVTAVIQIPAGEPGDPWFGR